MMQMRHTAHELRVTLDHVLQGGEASVAPQNPQSETVSFLNESEAEMRAIHNLAEVRTEAKRRHRVASTAPAERTTKTGMACTWLTRLLEL